MPAKMPYTKNMAMGTERTNEYGSKKHFQKKPWL
jgi:hypothetical protein